MRRNVVISVLLITLMLAGLGAIVYAQVTVQIGYPSSPADLGIITPQGYWIGQFPVTINGTTGEVYCMTPDGTVYEGSSYTANEASVPDNTMWQAISYLLSWYAPTDATSGAVDQVAIWELLGENPPYTDFALDSSITTPATTLAADCSDRNTALLNDTLTFASPSSASANAGDIVTFLVQLSSARPNVQIDFSASITPPGGSSTPLSSADVSPNTAFTDSEGMAQVSVAVPSTSAVGSTITVTAYTQCVWPMEYLDLLSYDSGAQNLIGLSPDLNLTASAHASVSQSLTVKAPVTITSNVANAGAVSETSGSYGQTPTAITATSNAGYAFLYWETTGGVSITSNLATTTTFTTSGAGTIEAFFEQIAPLQLDNVQLPPIATETGFMVPANVTLTNPNQVAETANVVITSGSTTLLNVNLNLNPQLTVTEPCYFNASQLAIGGYSCTVTVTTPAAKATSTQTATGNIGVTYVDDFYGAYKVTTEDFIGFVDAYIQYNSQGIYNPAYDLNHSGKIDNSDFLTFMSNYITYFQANP